ncbi:MAG: hypothetical protein JW913_04220 [Chitinispirillaceae bacterium]|nr:hypothetical protein [Chitinispirillaceae bacterium]
MRRISFVILAGLPLALLHCTGRLAGGGTETTNGISGMVARAPDWQGEGPQVIAAIYSVDFRPDSGIGVAGTTFVDASGAFHFDPPRENRYNLFVWDTLKRQGVHVPDLPADTTVGAVTLTGTGTIVLNQPMEATETKVELMIRGSPFYYTTASGTSPSIHLVPKGTYKIDLRASTPLPTDNGVPIVTERDITIDPGVQDTVTITVP